MVCDSTQPVSELRWCKAARGYMVLSSDPGVYQHRYVWEQAHGPIPPRHHIHHKNKVRDDNRLENLECIEKHAHMRLHMADRLGPERALAMRRGVKTRKVTCKRCGAAFETNKPIQKHCSHECAWRYRNEKRDAVEKVIRAEARKLLLKDRSCGLCGTLFTPSHYWSKYCKPHCKAVACARVSNQRLGKIPTPKLYKYGVKS